MEKRDAWVELGALVKNARKAAGLTQPQMAALLAAELGEQFTQGMVSENEGGKGWGARPRLPAAYGRILNISTEVQAALGLPDLGDSPPETFADKVLADPSLDDAAKQHLIQQYALLQAATRHHRANPSAAAG